MMLVDENFSQESLLLFLSNPRRVDRAITKIEVSSPDYDSYGFYGYMRVHATFYIKDLEEFTKLYMKCRRLVIANTLRDALNKMEKSLDN